MTFQKLPTRKISSKKSKLVKASQKIVLDFKVSVTVFKFVHLII